jgi:DNA-binding response OmpR family regulator
MKGSELLQAGGPAGAAVPSPTNASHRILVVDDDPYICHLSAEVLIRQGYEVNAAADGAAAWEALNDNRYDLLITDHNMPGLTGVELVKKLRSARMVLPVILVSGKLLTEELAQTPSLQLTAVLPKPFSIGELLETVKKVLCEADGADDDSQLVKQDDIMDNKMSPAGEPDGAPRPRPANSPHRILVVDDNNDTRQLSVDILVGSGYDVEAVKDGAAGWDALQANRYDLTITDNKMPRMTGIEMIAKLRSARMTLPVIMATSYLPLDEFALKPWLKPDAMLERPFSNDELLAAVKKVLRPDDSNAGCRETLLPRYL